MIFDGFTEERVDVGEATLHVRHGGSGAPVLLLHGHPRTHTTWHRVARLLAERHAVVCPDLRGYGRSTGPATTPDRGGYVALRTALDHPAHVTELAVLDGVPIGEALARADARFAALWWHWFFLGQTARPAERVICADPVAWYGSGDPEVMGAANHADYLAAIRTPAVVHAMCEDYRAGLGVDRAADDADRAAGRRIACPTLVLWALRDDLEALYGDPLAVWAPWASDLRGGALDCGHHMAEEAPDELAERLLDFLGALPRMPSQTSR